MFTPEPGCAIHKFNAPILHEEEQWVVDDRPKRHGFTLTTRVRTREEIENDPCECRFVGNGCLGCSQENYVLLARGVLPHRGNEFICTCWDVCARHGQRKIEQRCHNEAIQLDLEGPVTGDMLISILGVYSSFRGKGCYVVGTHGIALTRRNFVPWRLYHMECDPLFDEEENPPDQETKPKYVDRNSPVHRAKTS